MIDAEKATYPVTRMVDLLEVSRSGYYAWAGRRDADPGPRAARLADLTVKIKVAHDASDGVNGAPRILADLREAGDVVFRKTVAKLMRDNEIRGIRPRPWQPVTTIADANAHTIPDLVKRRFHRGALNVVELRHHLPGHRRGLAVPVRGPRRLLPARARISLLRAPAHRRPRDRAAPRGHLPRRPRRQHPGRHLPRRPRLAKYTFTHLADVADRLDVQLSVGRTGVCWDNAQQESFWSTLKTEHYHRHNFATRTQAILAVSSWIEDVYNRRQRHSALGQTSPVAFEHHLTTGTAQAA